MSAHSNKINNFRYGNIANYLFFLKIVQQDASHLVIHRQKKIWNSLALHLNRSICIFLDSLWAFFQVRFRKFPKKLMFSKASLI